MATGSKRITGVRLLRFGLSGAIAAALIFVGLWAAAQLPMGPSDMIADLFTTRGPETIAELKYGALFAAVIGFFAGAISDLVYDTLRWIEHR